MEAGVVTDQRRRSIRKTSQSSYIISRNAKNELRKKIKKVSEILKKPEQERTTQDKILVKKNPDLVKVSQQNAKRLQNKKDRLLEVEDEPQVFLKKCEKLADLIKCSKNVIVYTGAGISTAASIPDYRGPNGVWTLLKKGQELSPQDLSDAEPTFTHMSLTQLYRAKKVKHIVSQNCDGLHLRSGFPRHATSEVHGNMYIECCYTCAPYKEFIRLFDVTEHTGFHRHSTSRRCRSCGGNLQDTIVHFGEKGKVKSPHRWREAVRSAKRADLILCLGSSLKVLRKYSCLWCMDKKRQDRPKLAIVNLQWTPKDDVATLKINGKCDEVMMNVMALLKYEVPKYNRELDPIFHMYTPLRAFELKTTTKKILIPPAQPSKKSASKYKSNVSQPATRRKSSRVGKSAARHTFFSCSEKKNPQLSSRSDEFGLHANDSCVEMKHQDSCHQEKFITNSLSLPVEGDSPAWFGHQHKSVDYNNDVQFVCDVTELNMCCFSDKEHDEESCTQSKLVTCVVPEDTLLLEISSSLHSFDCQLEADISESNKSHLALQVHQGQAYSSLSSCTVEYDRQRSILERNGACLHRNHLSFQNKSIPELVVVNLGKNEQQTCTDQYIFHNQPAGGCETLLVLRNLETDNSMFSNLAQDVCETLVSSSSVYNSSPALGRVFCHQDSSGDVTHFDVGFSESSIPLNIPAKPHGVRNSIEMTHGSDMVLVPLKASSLFDGCTGSLVSAEKFGHSHVGSTVTMADSSACVLVDDIKQQSNNKAVQTLQLMMETVNSICHDHNYTLTDHQQTTKPSSRPSRQHYVTGGESDHLDLNTRSSPQICLPGCDRSHAAGSICTYRHLNSSSAEVQKILSTNALEIKSVHVSAYTDCSSQDKPSLVSHSHCEIEQKDISLKSECTLHTMRSESNSCVTSDVPTCILNMDDMDFVYTQTNNQPGLSVYFNDHSVGAHTVSAQPTDVIFPWNYDILVLPSDNNQLHLSQGSQVETYASDLSDSCYLVTENSTFYCDPSHINCFISSDLIADPGEPCTADQPNLLSLVGTEFSGMSQKELCSFVNTKHQSLSTFRDKNIFIQESAHKQFPDVEQVIEPSCNVTNDNTGRCHLSDTFLKLQQNLDKKKVNCNLIKCHQVSKVRKDHKQGREGRENLYKQKCRPKPSVPGWFGKGLIVKRRRKL